MIKTTNIEWGFFGTSKRNYDLRNSQTEELYNWTAKKLMKEIKVSEAVVVQFLDSKMGRHFSDALSFFVSAKELEICELTKAVELFLKSNQKNWLQDEFKDLMRTVQGGVQ